MDYNSFHLSSIWSLTDMIWNVHKVGKAAFGFNVCSFDLETQFKRMWKAWNERLLRWCKAAQFMQVDEIKKTLDHFNNIRQLNECLLKICARDFGVISMTVMIEYCSNGSNMICVKATIKEVNNNDIMYFVRPWVTLFCMLKQFHAYRSCNTVGWSPVDKI